MSNMNRTFVTTSWDDGHPLDLRVAELLAKSGLTGTFYVPRSSQKPVMNRSQIRELSNSFEIGAHTLEHVMIDRLSDREAASSFQVLARVDRGTNREKLGLLFSGRKVSESPAPACAPGWNSPEPSSFSRQQSRMVLMVCALFPRPFRLLHMVPMTMPRIL